MTECTTTAVPFSSLGRREIHADFSGGQITSDAGTLLLREADKQIGLVDALNDAIPDPRNPGLITHPQRGLLAQRIFALAAGCEDLNDHQHLRDDPLWQLATEHPEVDGDATLASPPTLCRLENRVTKASLVRIANALVDVFLAAHATPPEEVVLDFDATDDPVHGHQEQRFFHGYYDSYCFLPLYVFTGDHLLCAYLRPSKIDGAKHSRAILKWLVTRLRERWPNVRIVVRADSGFCRWRMLRWCDNHNVNYIVGLARNSKLEEQLAPARRQAKEAFLADRQAHRVFAEFEYKAESWDRKRRVIGKAEHLPGGDEGKANPRYVVTNLEGDARPLYEAAYCQRGEAENRIKEQQLMLFADRTSCHKFVANQFRVLLAAAAYVLVSHLRRVGLAGTDHATATVQTIRLKLFKVGAWVQKSARRWSVRMSGGYPWSELFASVAVRLSGPRFVGSS
jgi:Transposase DDE domain group 1